ncbi:hypothetical protein [Vibrio alginolyticus]|uniref:hypothetical protein n=1 Tax=Vibrio alginolyticus TaxID=663 RepID=UPI0006CA7EA7|nr:hypothetical protein [Vibrio alginolyticus]KPM98483.1 hypothetical protein AOG25_08545 [Vibrio alginolyticus]CAH7144072.1 conserved hypothetical protein [Vibrio chagasii]CAH7234987.1 conserved hypothetical protein [Vibrio chagasii]
MSKKNTSQLLRVAKCSAVACRLSSQDDKNIPFSILNLDEKRNRVIISCQKVVESKELSLRFTLDSMQYVTTASVIESFDNGAILKLQFNANSNEEKGKSTSIFGAAELRFQPNYEISTNTHSEGGELEVSYSIIAIRKNYLFVRATDEKLLEILLSSTKEQSNMMIKIADKSAVVQCHAALAQCENTAVVMMGNHSDVEALFQEQQNDIEAKREFWYQQTLDEVKLKEIEH